MGSIADRIGSWTCRIFDGVGFDPTSCNDFEGRGVIGLVSLAVLFVGLLMSVA